MKQASRGALKKWVKSQENIQARALFQKNHTQTELLSYSSYYSTYWHIGLELCKNRSIHQKCYTKKVFLKIHRKTPARDSYVSRRLFFRNIFDLQLLVQRLYLINILYQAVCYYHVTYDCQSEFTLYVVCPNVKGLVARSRRHISTLSGSNGIWTYHHLIRKRTLSHLATWLSIR